MLDESFNRGQVFVGLKDALLEPSNPLCHTTELGKILCQENISSTVLLLYTDGGPDHNLTFLSVRLALLALYSVSPKNKYSIQKYISTLSFGYPKKHCCTGITLLTKEIITKNIFYRNEVQL